MKQEIVLKHEFVDFIPDELEERTIYISIRFATASHLCCCGCGNKVVTPIRPTDWKLIFDGKTVSFHPSIGNWSFACRSHYWIRNSRIKWAPRWSQAEIERGRSRDRSAKRTYFGASGTVADSAATNDAVRPEAGEPRWSFWHTLKKWWS
jgi:hypothetical protein